MKMVRLELSNQQAIYMLLFYVLSVALCYIFQRQQLYNLPNPGKWVYWVPVVNTIYGCLKALRYFENNK